MDDTSDKRTRRDFEDQQNELAGRDTGRIARFGVGVSRAQELKEKERKERAYRDALDRLLATDPEYRALSVELGTRLGNAEREADTAIEVIQVQLRQIEQALTEMEVAAARGPDGNPVFRYADGRVVTADGKEVPPEIAEGVIWPDAAPGAEDYFAAKDRQDALSDQLDDWNVYRSDTLGGIRNRYDDRDNPMSKDDMRDALDQIEKLRPAEASLDTSSPQDATLSSAPQAFPDFS